MTTELALVKTYSGARSRIFAAGIKKQREIEAQERHEQKVAEERRCRAAADGWAAELRKWGEEYREAQERKRIEAERRANEAVRQAGASFGETKKWHEELRKWGREYALKKRAEEIRLEHEAKQIAKRAAKTMVEEIEALFPMPETFVKRPIGEIVSDVLMDHGGKYTVYDILGKSRARDLVAIRHECIWEVFRQRPDMSVAGIARKFMRDHTSILHVVWKYQDKLKAEAAE